MNSQHTVNFYKLLAKKLKKEKNITHVQALNEISKQYGFSNWTDCQNQTISKIVYQTNIISPPISFTEWLTKQRNRDTPLGDLSKDMLNDKRWPSLDTFEGYEDHLYSMRASWQALETLKKAWKSYKAYLRSKSAVVGSKQSKRNPVSVKHSRKIIVLKNITPIHYSKRTVEKFEAGDEAWISWDGQKAIPVIITDVDDRHYSLSLERPLKKAGNKHYLFLDEVRSTPELACLNMVTL